MCLVNWLLLVFDISCLHIDCLQFWLCWGVGHCLDGWACCPLFFVHLGWCLHPECGYLQQRMKQEAGDAVSILTEPVTRWPFFVFMGGSMFCLLSSTFCHLLNCHSSSLTYWLLRLDYAGIGIMIATSFFPPIYYVFLCQPGWRHFYLTSISVIGIATVIISLIPVFQTAKYRAVRGLAFAGMGLSGIIPGAHALMNFYQEPYCLQTLVYELGMAFFYLVGAAIYVTRIPERWRPGLFDIAGQSHQIFHVLVVAGAFTHYKGGLIFLEWRDKSGCLWPLRPLTVPLPDRRVFYVIARFQIKHQVILVFLDLGSSL